MGRPSRYPDEFRHQAVQMALATQDSPASVARWRGISEMTPRKWVANYLAGEARQADPLAVSPSEFEELRRLRCEAGELRAEKEIVRKAADYFAQETIRSAVSGSSPITVRLRRQAALPGPRCLPLGVLRRRRPAATPAAAPPAPRWPFPPAPHSSSPASPSARLAGAETTPPPGPFFAPLRRERARIHDRRTWPTRAELRRAPRLAGRARGPRLPELLVRINPGAACNRDGREPIWGANWPTFGQTEIDRPRLRTEHAPTLVDAFRQHRRAGLAAHGLAKPQSTQVSGTLANAGGGCPGRCAKWPGSGSRASPALDVINGAGVQQTSPLHADSW